MLMARKGKYKQRLSKSYRAMNMNLFYFSYIRHFLREEMIFRDPDFNYFILLLYSNPDCKIILINNWVTE